MLLLGLDTATPAVTVALHDGGQPLAQLVTVDAHRHAELLAPAIAKVIADAGAERGDLTGVAVGVGPGPYTGLRVGIVTAKVLGAALGIPVYGVCSLDVIAADVECGEDYLVATDARRRELYWARYDNAGNRLAGRNVSMPAAIPAAIWWPLVKARCFTPLSCRTAAAQPIRPRRRSAGGDYRTRRPCAGEAVDRCRDRPGPA